MSRKFIQVGVDFEKLAGQFEREANKLIVDAAGKSGKYIADGNPIDTGLSSGNWEGAIGEPQREEQDRYYPTSSKSSMNTLMTKRKKTRQSVFVSNPVPYVRTLNVFGTSPQANAFWVERASERGLNETIKNARILKDG